MLAAAGRKAICVREDVDQMSPQAHVDAHAWSGLAQMTEVLMQCTEHKEHLTSSRHIGVGEGCWA